VLVRRLDGRDCPLCGAAIGVATKEEPSGWKVYRVCLAEEQSCRTRRVGSIARSKVSHSDELEQLAVELL